jgi:PLP dependent protein
MDSIADRIGETAQRIVGAAVRSGRDAAAVRLVAVTKRVDPERIRQAAWAGVTAIGESYVQEARTKRDSLADLSLEWRLIGHLQTNKARDAAALFNVVETIDRVETVRALLKARGPDTDRFPVLVQVRLGGSEGRSGVLPDEMPALLESLAAEPGLRLHGLMGIPARVDDPDETRRSFVRLRELWQAAGQRLAGFGDGVQWDTLSMGMSGDFEIAIEEGSTEVRIGTAIFGARTAPGSL